MGFVVALQFLTAIPALMRREPTAREMGHAMSYYPLVGALLGLVLLAMALLLSGVFPAAVNAALLVVAWVLLTGGLHLDGLKDVCDGVFSQPDAARRLEVMRDTRAGSYGVMGVACLLLVKYGALFSVVAAAAPSYLSASLAGLVLAPTLGRWAMVLVTAGFPGARPEGLGQLVKASVGPAQVIGAGISAGAIALIFAPLGLALLVVAGAVAWLLGLYFRANLGGLTGDTYGAINEVVEAAVLLGALANSMSGSWWNVW